MKIARPDKEEPLVEASLTAELFVSAIINVAPYADAESRLRPFVGWLTRILASRDARIAELRTRAEKAEARAASLERQGWGR